MNSNTTIMNNKGFIQIVIILVLFLIILSLLGVSLSSLFANPILAENFGFVKTWGLWLWNNYISAPFYYVWNIFIDLIWNQFVDVMKGIKNGVSPAESTFTPTN